MGMKTWSNNTGSRWDDFRTFGYSVFQGAQP